MQELNRINSRMFRAATKSSSTLSTMVFKNISALKREAGFFFSDPYVQVFLVW
jgi:hypothetical protein